MRQAPSLPALKKRILDTVARSSESISRLAPRGILPEYYVEELSLYLSQPDRNGGPSKLFGCSAVSITRGMLRVAQTGLSLGVSCDLLPSGRTCKFSPRYTGIIELALQSGVRAINADVVYSDDEKWDYQKGTSFFLNHKAGPQKGDLTHFYAIAELKPGSFVFEVRTKEQVEAHKQEFSLQHGSTPLEEIPWYGPKTLIRLLSKFLPKSPRFTAALQFDNDVDSPDDDDESSYEDVLGSPASVAAA